LIRCEVTADWVVDELRKIADVNDGPSSAVASFAVSAPGLFEWIKPGSAT
jgi:hypothetical protein